MIPLPALVLSDHPIASSRGVQPLQQQGSKHQLADRLHGWREREGLVINTELDWFTPITKAFPCSSCDSRVSATEYEDAGLCWQPCGLQTRQEHHVTPGI